MDYIRGTKENIDREHICCAMSGKQSLAKKEWLKQRFEEGLVFYRSGQLLPLPLLRYIPNILLQSSLHERLAPAHEPEL